MAESTTVGGPAAPGTAQRERKNDQPTAPHGQEHDDPAERAKTAMHKADEQARRVKRPGASGLRGGTSKD